MIDYKQHIANLIKDSFPQIGEFAVVNPPKEELGDFSVGTFTLNIDGLKNPVEKAIFMKNVIEDKSDKYISKVAVAGPYLNFYINRALMAESVIKDIMYEKDKFGSMKRGNGESLLIEHTSINPNASPHIGRARNSIIGNFLTRLFRFVGYDVETHYFINDIGKQISMLVVGIEHGGDINNISFSETLALYVKINEESKTNVEIEKEVFKYLNDLENGNEQTRDKFKKITDICVKGQQEIFAKMGIGFDVFTHESDFVFGDTTKQILESLRNKGKLCEDDNGRLYVDLSGYDIPTKSPVLVLTREDKTSLYPLRDIAYTIYKMKLNPKNNYIVLGEDQKVYMQQISAVLNILGYGAPELISYSFVLLNGDKMATRQGKVVLLEDFLEEAKKKLRTGFVERGSEINEDVISSMASSCVKYNMLNVHRHLNVNFNLEEATNFQGDSAVYLLYNYARINNILAKTGAPDNSMPIEFVNSIEYSLISDLYSFPEIIQNVLSAKESVILIKYLHALAQKFAKYYNEVHINNEQDSVLKNSRVLLIMCIKTVLENGMNVLGITPIEKL